MLLRTPRACRFSRLACSGPEDLCPGPGMPKGSDAGTAVEPHPRSARPLHTLERFISRPVLRSATLSVSRERAL
jgi:hypothetical protein